eukprot:scaffold521_cov167-Amphora_coffeaeformis.AAC.27
MKRKVYACLFVFVLISLYSSFSTTSGKSSFFYAARQEERKEVSSHSVNGTTTDNNNTAMTTVRTTAGTFMVTRDPNETLSILVQLSGEMGNNLQKIGHGICLQEWLREEFNARSTIYLRHQTHPKWIKGFRPLNACFAWTRKFDFSAGNTPSIDRLLSNPPEWWNNMMKVNSDDATLVHKGLQFTVDAWRQGIYSNTAMPAVLLDGTNLTVPFLYANIFVGRHVCMDRYYDIIRSCLRFDSEKCCGQKPEPNETVFHFRDFLGEMPNKGKRLGFEELNPHDTAHLLFSNLREGDRVAITGRHPGAAQPYVDALLQRNISARIIRGQSDVQDFCFMLSAQRELVGTAHSTFVECAGLLSTTSVPMRLYSVNSPSTRRATGAKWFRRFNWTHPNLRERFSYEAYEQP